MGLRRDDGYEALTEGEAALARKLAGGAGVTGVRLVAGGAELDVRTVEEAAASYRRVCKEYALAARSKGGR